MILQADHLNLNLEEQIELIKFFKPDVIIIEGYKYKDYPKLLLLRNKDDLPLLDVTTNICAVGYWLEELNNEYLYPSFSIKEDALIHWTAEFILKNVHKNDEKS